MSYVICNDDNDKYLACDNKLNIFTVVHTLDQARKWNDISKANNVCNFNAKTLVEKYQLKVRYVYQTNPVARPVELECDILDKIKEISEFTRELEERKLYLMEKIQIANLDIVDIEHAAEFYTLNASQGYKLYKMLHDVRVERRKYKNELQKINLTLGTSIKSKNIDNLEKSIAGLENKKYRPRVNKELFGV